MSSLPIVHSSIPVPARRPPLWAHRAPGARRPPLSRAARTRLAERGDRLSPSTAGLLAGAPAGVAMLFVAQTVEDSYAKGRDVVLAIGDLASRGVLRGDEAYAAGIGAALVAGAIIGLFFALTTRHLRRFFPLVFWAIVFFPALWTGLYALLLQFGPSWFAQRFAYEPLLAGSAVFAMVSSLQVLLRARKHPRRVAR